MPIRLRLALVVSAIAAVLAVGGGLLFDTSSSRDLRATLQRTLQQRAGRVDAQLAAHLLPLAARAAPVRPAPDQSLVQVVAADGTLRYTTATAGTALLISRGQLAAARRHRLWSQQQRAGWKNPRLLLAEPGPGASGEVVIVGTSLDQLQDSTRHVHLALLVGVPLLVLLSGAGAWALAGRALEPVERLRSQAADLSGAEPAGQLAVPDTRDELAALAATLNDLLGRLHGALREQRHFVAAASHELRTPLAALRAQLDLANRPGRSHAELAAVVGTAARRVDQLVQLSNRLLVLAQADEGALGLRRHDQPIEPIVADSLEAQRVHADNRAVVLVLDADPDVHAAVDETRVREVVDNLLDNAIRHAPAGSLVEVTLRDDHGWALVEIRDSGAGFPPDFLPRAFDAFSRPDPSRARHGGGSGLGLTIVDKIVTAHGGSVSLANRPAGGADVQVRLPATASPGSSDADPGRARGPAPAADPAAPSAPGDHSPVPSPHPSHVLEA